MFAITNLDVVDGLERDGKVVSVLVAQQLNQNLLDWIFKSWRQLNQISGHNWHFAVPTYQSIDDKYENATPENFNFELSETLRQGYGLDWREVPCLVFDNFNDEQAQRYIPLTGSEDERTYVVQLIAEKINKMYKKVQDCGNIRSIRYRITEDIIDQVNLDRRARKLIKIAPQVGSSLAKFLHGAI